MDTQPLEKQTLRILFLASDPDNLTRLHLGKELQAVRNKLAGNINFEIKDNQATKPNDVMNEIMNYKPHIVHFSGHGQNSGELCFEDENGNSKVIPPEALASLFSLATDYVKCVIVNTCYAEKQAKSIAQFIPVVIGTKKEISDDAAINFSTGFYTALSPDLSQNSLIKAFELGKIAIQFDGNPEEVLTPVLLLGSPEVRFASEVDLAFSTVINPKGNAVNTLIRGLTLTGQKMQLPLPVINKIIDDKIWRLTSYNENILEYESHLKEILRDEFPLSESSLFALNQLQNGLGLSNQDAEIVRNKIVNDPKLDSAYSWYDRGYGQYQLGNHDRAIEYYTKAIERNPEYSGALAARGLCYSKKNDFMKAIEDYDTAIKLNKNWEVYYTLSLSYFDRGLAYFSIIPQTEETVTNAKNDWSSSIDLNPNDPNAFLNRGLAYQFLRRFNEAIHDFKKSLEIGQKTDKEKARIVTSIVRCYSELGDEKAIKEWTENGLKYLGKAPAEPEAGLSENLN